MQRRGRRPSPAFSAPDSFSDFSPGGLCRGSFCRWDRDCRDGSDNASGDAGCRRALPLRISSLSRPRSSQPAMVRAHSRACALSVTLGNNRRSSTAADNSPPRSNAVRAAVSASETTNMPNAGYGRQAMGVGRQLRLRRRAPSLRIGGGTRHHWMEEPDGFRVRHNKIDQEGQGLGATGRADMVAGGRSPWPGAPPSGEGPGTSHRTVPLMAKGSPRHFCWPSRRTAVGPVPRSRPPGCQKRTAA
jgi:hypothetical protein